MDTECDVDRSARRGFNLSALYALLMLVQFHHPAKILIPVFDCAASGNLVSQRKFYISRIILSIESLSKALSNKCILTGRRSHLKHLRNGPAIKTLFSFTDNAILNRIFIKSSIQ